MKPFSWRMTDEEKQRIINALNTTGRIATSGVGDEDGLHYVVQRSKKGGFIFFMEDKNDERIYSVHPAPRFATAEEVMSAMNAGQLAMMPFEWK